MKNALFKLSGEPADGDLAIMAYTTPRGGVSSAKYVVKGPSSRADLVDDQPVRVDVPGDTLAEIAKKLVDGINNPGEWCRGEFQATATADMIMVSCSDNVSDVIFIPQFVGVGTGKIELIG